MVIDHQVQALSVNLAHRDRPSGSGLSVNLAQKAAHSAGCRYLHGRPESWWLLDLGTQYSLSPAHYTLRHDGSQNYVRSWALQVRARLIILQGVCQDPFWSVTSKRADKATVRGPPGMPWCHSCALLGVIIILALHGVGSRMIIPRVLRKKLTTARGLKRTGQSLMSP